MIGETVYLQTDLKDTKFYPYIPTDEALKPRWYKDWWAAHANKPARVIYEQGNTLHIQFDGETTAYLVGRGYLRETK